MEIFAYNDNNYYVNYLSNNLTLLGQNGKGILLDSNNNNTPYYTDGTTNTSLIPTIPNWGSIGGTITNQTDLTTYINQLISAGVSNMLKLPNFNNAVSFTFSRGSYGYTAPSNGYIVLTSTSLTTGYLTISGKQVFVFTSSGYNTVSVGTWFPVKSGNTVSLSINPTGGTSAVFLFVPMV